MIVQLARVKVEPGKMAEAEEAAKRMAAAVEKNEPGVLKYLIYNAGSQANELVFFEIFEDQSAFDAHHEPTPQFTEWRSHFGPIFAEDFLEVERLNPLCGYSRPGM